MKTIIRNSVHTTSTSHDCLIGEIKGKKPGTFLQGPATTPQSIATLRAAIKTGTPCVTEVLNYHKDQSIYRVQIELHPWKDETSSLKGFMAIERKLD